MYVAVLQHRITFNYLHIIGTEAVLKMFVPVCPCSLFILPQPAMKPAIKSCYEKNVSQNS